MEINGIVNKVIWRNDTDTHHIFTSNMGTITGFAPNISIGMSFTATGEMVNHPKYGEQFKADAIKCTPPSNDYGLIHLIANLGIKGVGVATAKKLVSNFGSNTLNKLGDATALKTIGIRSNVIIELVEHSKSLLAKNSQLRVLLGKSCLGGKTIDAIIKYNPSYKTVTENPYSLLGKIPRLRFKDVDSIYTTANKHVDSDVRALASILEVFRREHKHGNSGATKQGIVCEASKLIGMGQSTLIRVIDAHLDTLFIEYPLNSGVIYEKSTFDIEKHIAERLITIHTEAPQLKHITPNGALNDEQYSAVTRVISNGVVVITGSPGTGKTTTTKAVCELAAANKLEVILLAPTAMAAKRMAVSTGLRASTIHSFLMTPRHKQGTLFIIDEVSMLSCELLHRLLKVIKRKCRLVLVGDVDQLQSIEWGSVLFDVIESNRFPVVRLTKTYRFGDVISEFATRVLNGTFPEMSEDIDAGVSFIECTSGEEIACKVGELVNSYPNALVLSPIKLGDAGTTSLNKQLACLLNPDAKRHPLLCVGVGDKVVITKNNNKHELINGVCGTVQNLTGDEIEIEFDHNNIVVDIDEVHLSLGYALTVHKAQGHECDIVIFALGDDKPIMLQRRILYTAITRAKQKIVIVGSRRALEIAISNQFDKPRITSMLHHLT